MKNLLKSFHQDESGATAIEYGLIAALVGVALVIAMGSLGDGLKGIFGDIEETLTSAGGEIKNPTE